MAPHREGSRSPRQNLTIIEGNRQRPNVVAHVSIIVGGLGQYNKIIIDGSVRPSRELNISTGKRPGLIPRIYFDDEDLSQEVKYPHCDALVVYVLIGDLQKSWDIARLLVDSSSNTVIISIM